MNESALKQLSVRKLREYIAAFDLNSVGLAEKSDLIKLILESRLTERNISFFRNLVPSCTNNSSPTPPSNTPNNNYTNSNSSSPNRQPERSSGENPVNGFEQFFTNLFNPSASSQVPDPYPTHQRQQPNYPPRSSSNAYGGAYTAAPSDDPSAFVHNIFNDVRESVETLGNEFRNVADGTFGNSNSNPSNSHPPFASANAREVPNPNTRRQNTERNPSNNTEPSNSNPPTQQTPTSSP